MTNEESGPLPRRRLQPKRGERTRHIIRLLLFLFAVVVVVDALVGEQGLLAMMRAEHQYTELAVGLARQRAENARLAEWAQRLKYDPAAIEEVARRDLGLIRPGEKVFIIQDLPSPSQP